MDDANDTAPPRQHIAEIDFVDFYAPAFPDRAAAAAFYERVKKDSASNNRPKLVLHQAARMIWLADRVEEVARGRPAFQVMFYLIAAEAVAKLVFDFQGHGQSRKHIRRFFEEICCEADRERLARAFRLTSGYLNLRQTIDQFYLVRCDVAHEAMYYRFVMKDHESTYELLSGIRFKDAESLTIEMSLQELRQIVLRGAVQGCLRLMPSE